MAVLIEETCEPLKSDDLYSRRMQLGSLQLLHSILLARGIVPLKPVRISLPPSTLPKPVYIPTPVPREAVSKGIIRMVAESFGLEPADLRGKRRGREFIHARAVAIRLLRDLKWDDGRVRFSFPQIGRMFDRDHSTICHSLDMFDLYRKQNPEVGLVYEALSE